MAYWLFGKRKRSGDAESAVLAQRPKLEAFPERNSSGLNPSRAHEHNEEDRTLSPERHLLQLPPSVLRTIAKNVVVSETTIKVHDDSMYFSQEQRTNCLPILRACHQLRATAVPLLYTENSFEISIVDFNAEKIMQWWSKMAGYKQAILRRASFEDWETIIVESRTVLQHLVAGDSGAHANHPASCESESSKQQITILPTGSPNWRHLEAWLRGAHHGDLPAFLQQHLAPEDLPPFLSQVSIAFEVLRGFRDMSWEIAKKALPGLRMGLATADRRWMESEDKNIDAPICAAGAEESDAGDPAAGMGKKEVVEDEAAEAKGEVGAGDGGDEDVDMAGDEALYDRDWQSSSAKEYYDNEQVASSPATSTQPDYTAVRASSMTPSGQQNCEEEGIAGYGPGLRSTPASEMRQQRVKAAQSQSLSQTPTQPGRVSTIPNTPPGEIDDSDVEDDEVELPPASQYFDAKEAQTQARSPSPLEGLDRALMHDEPKSPATPRSTKDGGDGKMTAWPAAQRNIFPAGAKRQPKLSVERAESYLRRVSAAPHQVKEKRSKRKEEAIVID